MDQPNEQHTEQGILKTVEAAGDVTVERALVGVVNGRDVSMTQAGAGPIARIPALFRERPWHLP